MLVFIIFLCWILGNGFLLRGDIFTGGDLEGNLIAIIVVVIALFFDLCIPVLLIKRFKQCINEIISEIKRKRQEKYEQRNVDIVNKYKPGKMISLEKPVTLKIDNSLVNREVFFCVTSFKECLKDEILECMEIDKSIEDILIYGDNWNCEKNKYLWLSSKSGELARLKESGDAIRRLMAGNKVRFLNEKSCDALIVAKNALQSLVSDKQFVCKNGYIEDIIRESTPLELSIFAYKYDPLVLYIGEFCYCLFSNVIIVFDENGIFSNAIDPSAVNIIVERGKFENKILFTIGNATIEIKTSSEETVNNFEIMKREYVKQYNHLHNPILELLLLLRTLEGENQIINSLLKECNANPDMKSYFCRLEVTEVGSRL